MLCATASRLVESAADARAFADTCEWLKLDKYDVGELAGTCFFVTGGDEGVPWGSRPTRITQLDGKDEFEFNEYNVKNVDELGDESPAVCS